MNRALRVLIVDDERPARERLRELLEDGREQLRAEVAGEAASGPEALALLPECGADVALLDIHMPGMSGIELARHFLRLERPPAVIFVTAHDQHAVEAFEVNAIDYLLKPVRLSRLVAALGKAAGGASPEREQLSRADRGPRRYLSVAERGKVILVRVDDVLFLKAEQKYVTVRTPEREFLIDDSLSQLEQEFSAAFVRVHRNCLVARAMIRGVVQVHPEPEAREPTRDEPERGDAPGEPRWAVVLQGHPEPIAVSRRLWPVVKTLVRG